jgi:hypothetical protein
LSANFVNKICNSIEPSIDNWQTGLSSESYMISPSIHRNNLDNKYMSRSTLIGHKHNQDDTLITTEMTDLAPILYSRLCTGLEHQGQ